VIFAIKKVFLILVTLLLLSLTSCTKEAQTESKVNFANDSVKMGDSTFINVDSDYTLYSIARDYDPINDEYIVTFKFNRAD